MQLGEVVIESANEFASILVVSLDGAPLATSRKILIQAATEEKPYGRRVEEGRIEARITFRDGARFARAHACDVEGRRGKEIELSRRGDSLTMELPRDALYTILQVD